MHLESPTPREVLLTGRGGDAPLLHKLLCNGSHVVGLEPAATPDEPHAELVSLASVTVHVPSGADTGLQAWGRKILLITYAHDVLYDY